MKRLLGEMFARLTITKVSNFFLPLENLKEKANALDCGELSIQCFLIIFNYN